MNQQKVALITDSCADLRPEHIGEDPIFVVPLTITCGGKQYEDGVDITADQVYEMAKTELPKTSLPRPEAMYQTLKKIQEEGYEKVIAVMLSSGLSGTYNLMRVTAQDFEDLEVLAVDSISASVGSGAMILLLMQAIKAGKSWEELKALVKELVKRTKVFFSVDTLEYLQKGGRIGRITALAGSVLNLKPIICFEPTGELGSIAKCRGSRQAQNKLIELAEKAKGNAEHYILMTAHGGAEEAYPAYREEVLKHFSGYQQHIESTIDATLGVYTGPGLLGIGVVVLDGIEKYL